MAARERGAHFPSANYSLRSAQLQCSDHYERSGSSQPIRAHNWQFQRLLCLCIPKKNIAKTTAMPISKCHNHLICHMPNRNVNLSSLNPNSKGLLTALELNWRVLGTCIPRVGTVLGQNIWGRPSPSSSLPFPSSFPFFFPLPPFRNMLGAMVNAVSFPSGNRILCILALKSDIWWHQIYTFVPCKRQLNEQMNKQNTSTRSSLSCTLAASCSRSTTSG